MDKIIIFLIVSFSFYYIISLFFKKGSCSKSCDSCSKKCEENIINKIEKKDKGL